MKSTQKTILQLLPGFETGDLVWNRKVYLTRALFAGHMIRAKALAEQWAPSIAACPEKIELIVRQDQEEDRIGIELFERLMDCGLQPCNLSICPVCLQKMREFLIVEAVASIAQHRPVRELPITKFGPVAVINSDHYEYPTSRDSYEYRTLGQIDLREIGIHIRAQHARANFPLAFAGIQIVSNGGGGASASPKSSWQVYINSVVVGWEPDAVESAVRRVYPKASIPKSLTFRKCSDLAAALDFAIKRDFARKIPQKPRLKKVQRNEIALWLSRYAIADRYVLTGCDFDGRWLELTSSAMSCIEALT